MEHGVGERVAARRRREGGMERDRCTSETQAAWQKVEAMPERRSGGKRGAVRHGPKSVENWSERRTGEYRPKPTGASRYPKGAEEATLGMGKTARANGTSGTSPPEREPEACSLGLAWIPDRSIREWVGGGFVGVWVVEGVRCSVELIGVFE